MKKEPRGGIIVIIIISSDRLAINKTPRDQTQPPMNQSIIIFLNLSGDDHRSIKIFDEETERKG